MNKLNKLLCAVALASVGSVANAGYFQLNVGNNGYDVDAPTCLEAFGDAGYCADPANAAVIANVIAFGTDTYGTGDADAQTGSFSEFGFNQLLGTSIYDFSNGSIFGDFYDTNIVSELNAAGVTDGVSGLALDGLANVTLNHPDSGQTNLDTLSPLAPSLDTVDGEGFMTTWGLDTQFHMEGTLTAGGPSYTGGFFNVYFRDANDAGNDFLGFSGEIVGSSLQAANLDISINLTYAAQGFLYSGQSENGSFKDVYDIIDADGGYAMVIDTNVNPPVPTLDSLLLVTGDQQQVSAVRQSTLDGSVNAVSEPSAIALLGFGLLAFGASRRRKA
jgi:hypothetical protein